MWERFSFYGMQGILLIYLYYSVADGGLGMDQAAAAGIVGAYGGAVYLSTILGAWLADRLIGAERMLFYSAIVDHGRAHRARRCFPGSPASASAWCWSRSAAAGSRRTPRAWSARSTPSTTRGATPASRSSTSASTSARFLGPLLTGLLQSTLGLPLGLRARRGRHGDRPHPVRVRPQEPAGRGIRRARTRCRASRRGLVIGIAIAAVAAHRRVLVLTGVVTATDLVDDRDRRHVVAAIVYFVVILSQPAASRRPSAAGSSRSSRCSSRASAFWSLYQQQFTVLTIYSDEQLNRNLFGWEMPVSWVQSINPVFIIILSGVFAAIWTKIGDRQPSTPIKFALGTAIMGVAFLLFLPIAGGGPNSTPLLGMVGHPVRVHRRRAAALAGRAVGRRPSWRPGAFHTQMVALFFLSVALGTSIAGLLAELLHGRERGDVLRHARRASRSCWASRCWLGRKPVLRLMAGRALTRAAHRQAGTLARPRATTIARTHARGESDGRAPSS